jgi:DNA-directed RNA polymerase specialized sigma24 family protein
MGRYLNPCYQGERLRDLLDMVPSRPSVVNVRTPKRVHRRLRSDQVDELVESYLAGSTLKEVAQQFGIYRTTVSELLEARGIERRYCSLTTEEIDQAVKLYHSGLSLVDVGKALGLNQSTVWSAMKDRGVPLRKPWERG